VSHGFYAEHWIGIRRNIWIPHSERRLNSLRIEYPVLAAVPLSASRKMENHNAM